MCAFVNGGTLKNNNEAVQKKLKRSTVLDIGNYGTYDSFSPEFYALLGGLNTHLSHGSVAVSHYHQPVATVEKTSHVFHPYPVEVEKKVIVPYAVQVPVEVPKPYPVHITKHVPYPVHTPVIVKVPEPYPVHVPQPYPVNVPETSVDFDNLPVVVDQKHLVPTVTVTPSSVVVEDKSVVIKESTVSPVVIHQTPAVVVTPTPDVVVTSKPEINVETSEVKGDTVSVSLKSGTTTPHSVNVASAQEFLSSGALVNNHVVSNSISDFDGILSLQASSINSTSALDKAYLPPL